MTESQATEIIYYLRACGELAGVIAGLLCVVIMLRGKDLRRMWSIALLLFAPAVAEAQTVVASGSTFGGCSATFAMAGLQADDVVLYLIGNHDERPGIEDVAFNFEGYGENVSATHLRTEEFGAGGRAKLYSFVVPTACTLVAFTSSGSEDIQSAVVLRHCTDSIVVTSDEDGWPVVLPNEESIVVGIAVASNPLTVVDSPEWQELTTDCGARSAAFVLSSTTTGATTPTAGITGGGSDTRFSVAVPLAAGATSSGALPGYGYPIVVGDIIDGKCVIGVDVTICVHNGAWSCVECDGSNKGNNVNNWAMYPTSHTLSPEYRALYCDFGTPVCGCTGGLRRYFPKFSTDPASMCCTCKFGCPPCDDCGDEDGDGIPNGIDTDLDGDGIQDHCDHDTGCNIVTACGDADGDGIKDACDPSDDMDNDGIPNDCDCSPGGPGCGDSCSGFPCAPGGDWNGDGVRNNCDTSGDVDGDGIPDDDDETPYGCDGTVYCPCYPCDDDGDADGDGLANNVDFDDDEDGIPDDIDGCPRGCDCCDDLNSDLLCADCEGKYDLMVDDGTITVTEDGCGDRVGDPLDSEFYEDTDTGDCDFDNDGCKNSDDAYPCDPERGCKCDLRLEERLQEIRAAFFSWLTDTEFDADFDGDFSAHLNEGVGATEDFPDQFGTVNVLDHKGSAIQSLWFGYGLDTSGASGPFDGAKVNSMVAIFDDAMGYLRFFLILFMSWRAVASIWQTLRFT